MDGEGFPWRSSDYSTAWVDVRVWTNLGTPVSACRSCGEPGMLWMKIVVGYCLLAGLGLWLGYRSRLAWPPHDTDDGGTEVDPVPPPR